METRLLNITGGKFKGIIMAMFLVVISLVFNVSVANAQFKEAGVQKFENRVDAPDFTLKELGGKEISLKELRGKVVVINFFTVD